MFVLGDFSPCFSSYYEKSTHRQSGTKPLEKIHKTRIFNLNVGNQRVKTFSHTPLPHTMLLLAGTFRSTLNGGGGSLEFYTNNRFARSSTVFNNFLNTFVPDCSNTAKVQSYGPKHAEWQTYEKNLIEETNVWQSVHPSPFQISAYPRVFGQQLLRLGCITNFTRSFS